MPNEVEVAVGQHVRWHLNAIEAALIETYPHRSHLIQEAFGAHRECRQSLSIQAFLSQADGIFYERPRISLFTKSGPGVASAFSKMVTGRFFRAALHPLTLAIPLWKHIHCLPDTFKGLNRHQVLHGMKADYNNELNSLRAISLLHNLVRAVDPPDLSTGSWAPTLPPPWGRPFHPRQRVITRNSRLGHQRGRVARPTPFALRGRSPPSSQVGPGPPV